MALPPYGSISFRNITLKHRDISEQKEVDFLSVFSFEGISLQRSGPVAQLVRAPPCHGGGHGFESRLGRFGILAQLGEHLPYKQRVTGSSPVGPILPMWLNWQSS